MAVNAERMLQLDVFQDVLEEVDHKGQGLYTIVVSENTKHQHKCLVDVVAAEERLSDGLI